MKKWSAPVVEELNIAETANGDWNGLVEFSHNGTGFNNDMFDGNDSNNDGIYGRFGVQIKPEDTRS